MKRFLILFIPLLLISNGLISQVWTQRSKLTGGVRHSASAFVLNDKGYVCTGDNGNLLNELWEYDPLFDQWQQRADLTGVARRSAVGFSIGQYGYVGCGWNGSSSYYSFYKYDPSNNSWSAISAYPGEAGRNCFAESANGKGYVGGGLIAAGFSFADDFWEYDPSTDQWDQLSDIPFGDRSGGIMFSINDIIYFGQGHNGIGDFNDLWAYDPANDSWEQKANMPGVGRIQSTAFVADDVAIVGGGWRLGVGTELNDYYEYDPAIDTWSTVPGFVNGRRGVSVGFGIGLAGYIATGWDSLNSPIDDLWEYNLYTSVEENEEFNIEVDVYPLPSDGMVNFQYSIKEAKADLLIYNPLGELIRSDVLTSSSGKYQLDLSGQNAGIYIYEIRTNNGSRTGLLPLVK